MFRTWLSKYKGGWVVGNFEPSLFRNEHVEVAIKTYLAGEVEALHKQIVATEITVVILGKIEMNSECLESGEIIVIEPGEPADFIALSDATLLCIKFPSKSSDKIILS
jgi:quercetin dioxygenase-like cupin family protein